MDIGGATLAGAAMRAGLIDEYALVAAPPATPAGRWCSRCRVGVQLVGVLTPR